MCVCVYMFVCVCVCVLSVVCVHTCVCVCVVCRCVGVFTSEFHFSSKLYNGVKLEVFSISTCTDIQFSAVLLSLN